MNILILTPYVPYPINSGGNQGFFALVDRLRKHVNINIVLLARESDLNNVEILKTLWPDVTIYVYRPDKCKIDVKNKSYYRFLLKIQASIGRKIKRLQNISYTTDLIRKNSFLSDESHSCSVPFDEDYIEFVHDIINLNQFDLIQIDFFGLIGMVNALPVGIKKVFIHHEIRYVRMECELSLLQERKPYDDYLFRQIKKYEIDCLNSYDAVVAMTDIDKEKLQRELDNSTPVFVSPAIVNIKNIDLKNSFEFNSTLVFLGGSEHFANLDGIDWFLNNCWTNILDNMPNIRLNIIGKWSPKLVKHYTSQFKNIHFKGFVDDLSCELSNTIMIVPIRIGSGVRMKILEAFNYGVPVVTTSIGCEGIGLINGYDCVIADDSTTFADSVLSLCCDNDFSYRILNNARQRLVSHSDPDKLAQIRLDIYKKV